MARSIELAVFTPVLFLIFLLPVGHSLKIYGQARLEAFREQEIQCRTNWHMQQSDTKRQRKIYAVVSEQGVDVPLCDSQFLLDTIERLKDLTVGEKQDERR